MYFNTGSTNVSVETCSFANNYAEVVKSYLALGIESKGVVGSLPIYLRPWPLGWLDAVAKSIYIYIYYTIFEEKN